MNTRFEPKNLTVGQEVVLYTGRSYAPFTFGFEVARVTPSGQVVVRSTSADGSAARVGAEFRFDKTGWEIGRSDHSRRQIQLDVAAIMARVEIDRLRAAAARAIDAVRSFDEVGCRWSTESMKERCDAMRKALCDAEVAVEFLRIAECDESERKYRELRDTAFKNLGAVSP